MKCLNSALTYTNFNYVTLPVMVFVFMLVQIIIYAHMEKLVLSVPTDTFLWVGVRCGWVLQA